VFPGAAAQTTRPVGRSSAGRHYDHQLTTILREDGNIPAIWTRFKGEATRPIGLAWIDEQQVHCGSFRRQDWISCGLEGQGRRVGDQRRHLHLNLYSAPPAGSVRAAVGAFCAL